MVPTEPAKDAAPSRAPIESIESLREHLQWAIELEHATLPPYLCALYSLQAGQNAEASEVVTSVFMEEMLHLTLAANLLNAVGGRPVLDAPRMMPGYPTFLPHGDRSAAVSLVPFSHEALELFLRIEQPTPPGARPESDDYETIGQFYQAIQDGIRRLCARRGESHVFSGDPDRQVTNELAYGGAGQIVAVTDLASAMRALREIVEQGEGAAHQHVWDGDHEMFHPERDEVGHYYRFQELALGRRYRREDTPQTGPTGAAVAIDWNAVHPMARDPRIGDREPGDPIREAQEEFNRGYRQLLQQLETAFNGAPQSLGTAVGAMYALKGQAQSLMQMPLEDGSGTAGPTFEYPSAEAPDPQAVALVAAARPEARIHDAPGHSGDHEVPRIVVLPHGPYEVHGGIPLVRKLKVFAPENDQSLAWQTTESLTTRSTYRLCRCGHSAAKPFCDDSHLRVGFDGTETAKIGSYESRRWMSQGEGVSIRRVSSLCMHAAFCEGRTRQLDDWLASTGDTDTRAHVMWMVEHCPSGSYTYAVEPEDEAIEPDLPAEIAVVEEEHGLASALWVTGRISILRADGQPWETRNRVTLCRCGQSRNKPLCDGTHRTINFRE
ncbi:ferritin-like domain-containing protein [Nocardioides sp. YIM 152315]|uniref:ferritin-like domain-containing protein n=1 Tax=Nocardioides sp. YIM 152315 TaxID=3031760 RepID=UPI0023D9B314|nr:ferritin-like domain-containing protein [Nocardioides sp. YIM 152315]MDF1602043.1 ferritin-like domain-containing protein [Nocardioides sp. YIM 152315]